MLCILSFCDRLGRPEQDGGIVCKAGGTWEWHSKVSGIKAGLELRGSLRVLNTYRQALGIVGDRMVKIVAQWYREGLFTTVEAPRENSGRAEERGKERKV